MVMTLSEVFERAVDRYLESEQSSDESLSIDSNVCIDLINYKNKTSSMTATRHSQRYKHLQKLNTKTKINTKINKKKNKQLLDEFTQVNNEVNKEVLNVKEKKSKTKCKMNKTEKEKEEKEEIDLEDGNERLINYENVIKSKRGKICNDPTILRPKKVLTKTEFEDGTILNTKVKKKTQGKQSSSIKQIKNRKRKDDFEENYDSISIPKSKSRKIEQKESRESDCLIDRKKKHKIKKTISQKKLCEGKFSSSKKGGKNRKISKEKLESLHKKIDKKPKNRIIKNDIENVKHVMNTKKIEVKPFKSLIANKDIESLDALKDKISKRRYEEKLKLEQERKKKQSLKVNNIHGTSRKVPCKDNTSHNNNDKLDNKGLRFPNINKKEKNFGNNIKNLNDSEPKKISYNIKTSYSKYTKVLERGDQTIQALNQATEQTLYVRCYFIPISLNFR
jgi:hypothetical protein